MTDPSPAATMMARLDELATLTSETGALTRLYLTPEHAAAANLVETWMVQAGMTAHLDAVGTVVGRYPAAKPGAKTLILGSHLDTVRNAGRYDGNLGVVAAIAAVETLARAGEHLPFGIEVVAFGDEEGVRFPVTLSGSRALAGRFEPAALDTTDQDGVTMRQALRDFGCDPDAIPGLARNPADTLGYLEVHIEQGPVLEAEDLPAGIVTAIAGATRCRVTVEGRAGHAGTVPMTLRRDAFAAAAEMALRLEQLALDTPGLVATVGRIDIRPGAVNVIPAQAIFTVDLRSPDDATRRRALGQVRQCFDGIAERRGVTVAVESFYDEAAAPCSPVLRAALANAVMAQGLTAFELPSGAGHDGLAMIHLCPIGMLFVRCAGGISHHPSEAITAADADTALGVLLAFLRHFAPPAS